MSAPCFVRGLQSVVAPLNALTQRRTGLDRSPLSFVFAEHMRLQVWDHPNTRARFMPAN